MFFLTALSGELHNAETQAEALGAEIFGLQGGMNTATLLLGSWAAVVTVSLVIIVAVIFRCVLCVWCVCVCTFVWCYSTVLVKNLKNKTTKLCDDCLVILVVILNMARVCVCLRACTCVGRLCVCWGGGGCMCEWGNG